MKPPAELIHVSLRGPHLLQEMQSHPADGAMENGTKTNLTLIYTDLITLMGEKNVCGVCLISNTEFSVIFEKMAYELKHD